MMSERIHVVSREWLTVGAVAYGVVMLLSLMAGPSVLDNFHADQFLFFLVLVGLLVIMTFEPGERSIARIRAEAAHMVRMRGMLARPDVGYGPQPAAVYAQTGHIPQPGDADGDATARLYAAMAKNDRQQRTNPHAQPERTAAFASPMNTRQQSAAPNSPPAARRIVHRSPQRRIVSDIVVRSQAYDAAQRGHHAHRQYPAFRPRMAAMRPTLRITRSIDGFLPSVA